MDITQMLTSQPAVAVYVLTGGFLAGLLTVLVLRKKVFKVFRAGELRSSFRSILWPLLIIVPLLALKIALPVVRPEPLVEKTLSQIINVAIIVAFAVLAFRITGFFRLFLTRHYDFSRKDDLNVRKVLTQTRMIERIIKAAIIVIALSSILMSFDKVRQLGVSILASAGVVSIIAGLAAQKSIAALFAGIQIAMLQPIRIDDSVVVENEWGWVEEINLTYVVVKIWDQRRIILPVTYFMERPFQNWTRSSADLLGSVYMYADYTLPVQAVRDELGKILESTPLWDRRTWNLQVTGAGEKSLELRAVMSAANASDAWDLRCLVRERMIGFLQENFPQCLPRVRIDVESAGTFRS